MTPAIRVSIGLILISILLGGLAGCARASTPPAAQPTEPPVEQPTEQPAQSPGITPVPTLPPTWVTYTHQGQCSYAISHPANMEGASQGMYSWILSVSSTEPSGLVTNFVYISVIPDDFQSNEPGAIYNYDPAETQTLLNLQAGESASLREDPNLAPSFTYTRLPDMILSNQSAQTYENTLPWEFPPSTKELRYYVKANGCTYLIGGYLATVGGGQPMAIDEELFDQIIATFRLAP